MTGDPDALTEAGAEGEVDGEGLADVGGACGGIGVGDADELLAGAGAVRDTFGWVVSLLLLDDLQEAMSKAGVMTTRMSAARRSISGAP